ncbi:intermediate filament protein [Echinococcus multilocularis]|uniref:Intermediate filament protein n=1 Tax=Echinococcus multilocularis TaxID=6211 RepID=A0A068YFK7_ECHMU|nr:intermediate filament protein [Echinococcus multilocularis]
MQHFFAKQGMDTRRRRCSRVSKPVVYTKSLDTGKQTTRPYSAGGKSQDSGFVTNTGTIGSDQEGSELSPPLPVYSWESTAEEVAVKPRTSMPLRSTSRSMERLSRSAFELDIPDMRTAREERERSRREMRELNEKLAEQVEGMRYLSARNRQLTDEISNLKSRWLSESEKTKEIYEGELRQLRQLLDYSDREKAESLAKLLSLQQFSRNQEAQMDRLTQENDKVKRRLEQAFDDMNKRDSDFNTLQRKLSDLESELEKERMNSEKLRRDNETICQHLDEETANRISGQSEMQTLREEIDFMRRAHQEEIKEMHRTLNEVGRGCDREMWQTELSQAVHDIQNRYDDQLEKLKVDMEEMYNARLRELGKVNPEQKTELNALKSENSRLRQNSDGMREQIAQLQSKNAYLEKAMRDVSTEAEELRRRIETELTESAKEREAAEEALAKAHSEMAALMDVKLNLEGEIAAYGRLLDAQGGILSGGGRGDVRENVCGPTNRTRSSREVPSKPRPSSMSPQRRVIPLISSSDIPHRLHERSDPSGSSFRSRAVEFDSESEQQLSCSYKPERADQRGIRGELTARTQFDKSYKGAISIDECSPDGRYIVITNNGNTAENLNGWRIVRNIEHGKQIIRFTFGDTPMLPKSSRRIWARGQRGLDAGPKDLESPYSTWGVGGYIYTTLFTMDGEERATHAQRAEFNLS